MGEILALFAAFSFACANVMVKKGGTKKSVNNGVFLSLLITFLISGCIILVRGLLQGKMTYNAEGIGWFLLAGLLTAFIGRTLLFASIEKLGSVRASAIKRLNPLFTVLIGVLFLNESMYLTMFIGMMLIFGSFTILIFESLATVRKTKREALDPQADDKTTMSGETAPQKNRLIIWVTDLFSFGLWLGIVSALAYSIGYVVRKKGLEEIPDSYLGTMIGAFAGILLFFIFSLFQDHYRQSIRSAFSSFQPWLFGAGTATTLGQIFYFSALTYSEVSKVALITSTDVIFTLLLSSWIFKTQENITKNVIFASIMAMIGACFITVG